MNLQDVTFALVKPRDHDELVASLDAHQSGRDERIHVEPNIGCAFGSLLRRFATYGNSEWITPIDHKVPAAACAAFMVMP